MFPKRQWMAVRLLFRQGAAICRLSPEFEWQADGAPAVTWRSAHGILNVAVGAQEIATYAAYFVDPVSTEKGRFCVKDGLPDTVQTILERLD